MFFSVSAPVNPPPKRSLRISTSDSIVGVLGVSTTSSGGTPEASTAATVVFIASTFAA